MTSEPQFQFRGVWTPAELFFLYRDKKINPTEMTFLSLIDSLTQARGLGCWASNRWFSNFTGLHISTVKDILRKLGELNLIERTVEKGRRSLRVVWAAEVVPSTVRASTVSGTPQYLRSRYLDNIENSSAFSDGSKSVATFKPAQVKDEKYTDADLGMAVMMKAVITKVRQVHQPWSKKKWANTFRLLRKDLNEDVKRLVRVLNWWQENSKTKGVPTILNAMQFRKHFIWIEERMEKDVGKIVEVDAKTKIIAKRVVMKGWPGKSRDQVESCIQLSRKAIQTMVVNLNDILDDVKDIGYYYNFLLHLRSKIGDTDTFAEKWLNMCHARYAGWKEWNQDLLAHTFRPEHELFIAFGRRAATSYAQSPQLFNRFRKDLAEWT